MQRHRFAERLGERPQIVDAVDMVGVVVGDDQRVDPPDAAFQQLLAKVGAAIDEQASRRRCRA